MSTSQAKKAAMFAGGVVLTMLVFNTLANRWGPAKTARAKVDAGL
jgi:hypothetical protein